MASITRLTALLLLLFSTMVCAENDKESATMVTRFKQSVDASWKKNITPLSKVAGEKWASFMTSTSIDTDRLQQAVKETWNNTLKDSKTTGEKWTSFMTSPPIDTNSLQQSAKETWNNTLKDSKTAGEIGNAGSAIGNFVRNEITDTTDSARHSKALFKEGKLVDGLWYLSTHLLTDTDDNLATAVQESELINVLGQITATTYAGPQGAAAYASWYTYKKTKDPVMALNVGIASGTTNAGVSAINQNALSEQLKNRIISGIMAGLTAAVGGEDEKTVKAAFLKTSIPSLTEKNQ